MAKLVDRNPASAPGDWYIDRRCIDCGASRNVAPGLIVRREGKSVFARQPVGSEEEIAAWRAVLVCPTASVGSESHRPQPQNLFPQELAPGIYRCGYNASTSYGAHSYLARREAGNLMIDAPRYVGKLVDRIQDLGGIAHILLTHRDDVADADCYAARFKARVWIHEDDCSAAPYATDLIRGEEPARIGERLLAIPVPGHTRGSVVFLLDDTYLFTGDSLAWSTARRDLVASREVNWYSWIEQRRSLARLADHRFEWVLPGHGGSVERPADEMRTRLNGLVARM